MAGTPERHSWMWGGWESPPPEKQRAFRGSYLPLLSSSPKDQRQGLLRRALSLGPKHIALCCSALAAIALLHLVLHVQPPAPGTDYLSTPVLRGIVPWATSSAAAEVQPKTTSVQPESSLPSPGDASPGADSDNQASPEGAVASALQSAEPPQLAAMPVEEGVLVTIEPLSHVSQNPGDTDTSAAGGSSSSVAENSEQAAPPTDSSGGGMQPQGAVKDDVTTSRADQLFQGWSRAYGLQEEGPFGLPPESITGLGGDEPGSIPLAPHLEECTAVEQRHKDLEFPEAERAKGYPDWACGGDRCSRPTPPWVQGDDDDNLPLTRVAQRDIWVHQNPPDCSDPKLKFLFVRWIGNHNGIGSQLHIMTSALSLAMSSGRILIPFGYPRAEHQGCEGFGKRGMFECYFSPISSCIDKVEALRSQSDVKTSSDVKDIWENDRIVDLPDALKTCVGMEGGAEAAKLWNVTEKRIQTFELMGSSEREDNEKDKLFMVTWWRSQAARYFLRFPSRYLCHITNRIRHFAYGANVAAQLADTESAQEKIKGDPSDFLNQEERLRLLKSSEPIELMTGWRFRSEPYIPRPIISLHVRQGDKKREMALFSLKSLMWLAHRVRTLSPSADKIWLSSEMQGVVDASASFEGWKFFFNKGIRQKGDEAMVTYESLVGLETHVGLSLGNLIISSQCDFFVGVLGSNWNRLINELRMTNGRVKSVYVAANHDEWR